jgi:uncharacterized phage protein (TIGR01671 family)
MNKDRFKFRVWYKGAYTFFNFDTLNQESRGFFENEIKNNNVEQCTGLKDCNDNLIYENDIVDLSFVKNSPNSLRKSKNWWDACGPAGYDNPKVLVEWYDDITGFLPFDNYDCDCGVYHCAEYSKIIGNIHENSELLEEK